MNTNKPVDTPHSQDEIRSRLCAKECKMKKARQTSACLSASQLFSAMPPRELVRVIVSIMMSVGSSKGKPLKLRLRHQQSTSPRDQRLMCPFVFQRKIDRSMEQTKWANWSRCMEYKMPRTCGNLTMCTYSVQGFQPGKHSTALIHNANPGASIT